MVLAELMDSGVVLRGEERNTVIGWLFSEIDLFFVREKLSTGKLTETVKFPG